MKRAAEAGAALPPARRPARRPARLPRPALRSPAALSCCAPGEDGSGRALRRWSCVPRKRPAGDDRMDQSVAIQETLSAGETCLAAVQGVLLAGANSAESRLLSLVESPGGTAVVAVYTHRRMAIVGEDVALERVLPLRGAGFALEEVLLEGDQPVLGSDTTVQITTRDASLLVQLPFGSQTQTFLKEVRKRCHPGVARPESAAPAEKEECRPQGANGAAPVPSKSRCDMTGKMVEASSVLVLDEPQSLSVQAFGLRDTLIKTQLLQQEESYTHLQHFTFFAGTYNVNGQSPRERLQPWLTLDSSPPDVYCVGFQELDLSKEAFLFNDTPREEEWFRAVTESLHPGAKYAKIKLIRLVGILLLLYVRTELAASISEVEAATVGTGIMGRMGNKGGVGISFRLHNTSVCVVNAHLAAHPGETERRNQDFRDISARMQFSRLDLSLPPLTIRRHDVILWLGDLNYRLEAADPEWVKRLVEVGDFHTLQQYDQLKTQMEAKTAFEGFTEGGISFRPTYKYDPGSDNWDTSEKCRAPAWCDRILFQGETVSLLSYRSHMAMRTSDHKPVSAVFDIGVKVVDEGLYRKAFEEIVRSLDKMENASIPSITLSKREFFFKDVKYMQLQTESFTLQNGPVPCQFEFISKPNEDAYCKPWLRANPSKGFLLPDIEVTIELELFVNKSTAPSLNSGEDKLEDILVLHLNRGKDYFLSVLGNYLPSCFGCPIQALIHMREPIQEMAPEAIRNLILRPLEQGEDSALWEEKPLDIPKELWMMVDHLYRNACQQEDLFQQPGLRAEFEQIRDCLDTGAMDTLVGCNHSVAEALLLFLESLPEPVVCYGLYNSSLESADSYLLSSQVVSVLPKCHKNVFSYLVAFLRELLQHSSQNHLDVHILASLFGGLLLRPPPAMPKSGLAEKRKAQKFIRHFLLREGSTL